MFIEFTVVSEGVGDSARTAAHDVSVTDVVSVTDAASMTGQRS